MLLKMLTAVRGKTDCTSKRSKTAASVSVWEKHLAFLLHKSGWSSGRKLACEMHELCILLHHNPRVENASFFTPAPPRHHLHCCGL